MERSSKVFEGKIAHLDFRVVDFEILEPVDGSAFSEDVVGTDEYDIEVLQVAVFFAPAQGFAVAHGLVEACAFGYFLGVFHLKLDVETAKCFSVWAKLLREYIVADTLADGTHVDGLFWHGVAEFVNLDAKNRFVLSLKRIWPLK